MNTPNIRYYAKMVNTTPKGKKTPKYTITAQGWAITLQWNF